MKIFVKALQRVSVLTLALLLFLLLSILSYMIFPQAIYFFHKWFLNKYVTGLSLSKPIMLFMFLFAFSFVKDLLPKSKFTLPKWLTYQVIILSGFMLVALLGFMVFKQNVAKYTEAFPNSNITVNNAGMEYISYEAKTMFFYTLSITDHYHENKALMFPLAKYFGIEGDMGEAVYPFYPFKLMALAYLLFAIIGITIIQSLRSLGTGNKKLDTLLALYYLFTIFRLFHVSIDGGIFNVHVTVDVIAFIFVTALLVHLKNPHIKATAFIPPATVLAAPVIYHGIQAMQTAFLGIKGDAAGPMELIYFLEMLLVLSAATFLTVNGPKGGLTGIRAMLRSLLANKFALLALFLVASILFLYVKQMSAFKIATAFDPIGTYITASPQTPFILLATQTSENPCNAKPAYQFNVKGHIIRIYNATRSLTCQKKTKFYAYPIGYERRPIASVVLDCNTAIPNSYQMNKSVCYTTLYNKYDFFALAAVKSFPGQHLFFAYQKSPPKPNPALLRQNITNFNLSTHIKRNI